MPKFKILSLGAKTLDWPLIWQIIGLSIIELVLYLYLGQAEGVNSFG
jgi:hypothetical protein